MYDIIIRNGSLVDGTGAEPVRGDLAIRDGVIVAMGEVEGDATRTIDAEGMMVTPGFVDIHTHLDAQIGWDPDMTPVSWHGVTTALIGNCGVTFAPCRREDREFLAGMMETVEDIPREAILTDAADPAAGALAALRDRILAAYPPRTDNPSPWNPPKNPRAS